MAKVGEWLPTNEDRAYVGSLMGRVVRARQVCQLDCPYLSWASTASLSDFDYVRFN
jgi:benzoyl-CoA 2,3-dioxygenase component B